MRHHACGINDRQRAQHFKQGKEIKFRLPALMDGDSYTITPIGDTEELFTHYSTELIYGDSISLSLLSENYGGITVFYDGSFTTAFDTNTRQVLWASDSNKDTVTDHMVLYAAWEEDPTYCVTVTFRAYECDDQVISLYKGEDLPEAHHPELPERDGMVGIGWNIGSLTNLQEDVIVYGQYHGFVEVSQHGTCFNAICESTANSTVFVALYDNDGKMCAINMQGDLFMQEPFTVLSFDFTEEAISKAAVAKAFLFSDHSGPLCEAYSLPLIP